MCHNYNLQKNKTNDDNLHHVLHQSMSRQTDRSKSHARDYTELLLPPSASLLKAFIMQFQIPDSEQTTAR